MPMIIINLGFHCWIIVKKYNNYTNSKNNLFINACEKGNIIICNYLINKFNDIYVQKNFTPIDIHVNNELSFSILLCKWPFGNS